MKPTPISFNGTSLQSTDYVAHWVTGQPLQGNASATWIQRPDAWPFLAGKSLSENQITIGIICLHDFTSLFENLNALFDVQDDTPRLFVVRDDGTSSSDNEYQIYATAVSPISYDGGEYIVTLALETPIWENTAEKSVTVSITTTTDSTSFTVGGNTEVYPVLTITPGSGSSDSYKYNNYIEIQPSSFSPWINRALRLSVDTATLIGAGKMQADCDDLRIFRDGLEIYRWIDSTSINTTDTGVFINCDLQPKRWLELGKTINSTDPTPVIYVAANPVLTSLDDFPTSGRLLIENEEFVYSARKISGGTRFAGSFITTQRAARNTSAATHTVTPSAAPLITLIPFDLNMVYGNSVVSAPTLPDAYKPLIDLTSTNALLGWSSTFNLSAGTRSMAWTPYVSNMADPRQTRSGQYTTTQDPDTISDPAGVMGSKLMTYARAGLWRPENGLVTWSAYFPGITSLALTGQKYLATGLTSWPNYKLQTANVLPNWKTVLTIPAPASTDVDTWVSFSYSSSDISLPVTQQNFVRLYHSGPLPADVDTDTGAKVEINTISVGIDDVPVITFRGEQSDFFYADFNIYNAAGEYINFKGMLSNGAALVIDTNPEYPTATLDGVRINGQVATDTVRSRWLAFQPGTETLGYQCNLTTPMGASITALWHERLNFL